MDVNILVGGLGVVIATSGLVYGFLRNFKDDIRQETAAIRQEVAQVQRRQELADDRLFKLAMGYSFERLMTEERLAKNKPHKEG